MKGFLISPEDYEKLTGQIQDAGIDALARNGSMLHIFQSEDGAETVAELNAALNERIDLARYTEFVYSADTIAGFMLVLQNAFTAMLAAFISVLMVAVLIVLSHSISDILETERKNIGILKSLGFSEHALQRVQLMQYAAAAFPALFLGLLFAVPAARFLMRITLTTTGVLIPMKQPWGVSLITLLAFFASLIGRMDSWLGPDGKGMMDAFNPADHDIGVQIFGISTEEDALAVIGQYTEIVDTYVLAMQGVSVNGIDYTANVISDPDRFHILEGRTCANDDEVVLTEFAAEDLGVSIGDMVMVTGGMGEVEYVISGIYSCANDMGDNIGMSREGYIKIGADTPQIWCHHYFLEDVSQKEAVIQALTTALGGDVHVHENTWSGLNGIITAMRFLVAFMYAVAALFILIVTAMIGARLLGFEQRDIGIYKSLGFTDRMLRFSFALRFGLTAVIGSAIGSVMAATLTDPIVSAVMKLAGISNFMSSPSLMEVLTPGLVVTLLFYLFAYATAGKINMIGLPVLISE